MRRGFTTEDQEKIASKIQKTSNDSAGKTNGLGFISQTEKVQRVKDTVKQIQEEKKGIKVDPQQEIQRNTINAAINDESITTLSSVFLGVGEVSSDERHQQAIFTSSSLSMTQPSSLLGNITENLPLESRVLPLYKQLKVGDQIQARYTDGNYYSAEIISVTHGGYASAKYDIKFSGYSDTITSSWKDIIKVDKLERNESKIEGRVSIPSPADDRVIDEFGREIRPQISQSTQNQDSFTPSQSVSRFDPLKKPILTNSMMSDESASKGAKHPYQPLFTDGKINVPTGCSHSGLKDRPKELWRQKFVK